MKKTLLLLNLGSPENPDPKSVGKYLKEFLMDPLVLDIPAFFRWILVNILIVPRRKFRSAQAYKKVWTSQGSPLVENTRQLAEKLSPLMGDQWDVQWAMRYGDNFGLKGRDLRDIYLLPLYPQYALSSTQTALDQARLLGARGFYLQDFYDQPEFITAYAHAIRTFQSQHPGYQLLFSYHGLPKRHLTKVTQPESHCTTDKNCCDRLTMANRNCYRAQCMATTRAIAKQLHLTETHVSFQSRLGSGWITPFTDEVIEQWAQQGVKKVAVVCPSFVADCLETLEEVQMALKENFIEHGGQDLKLIPCLNASDQWARHLQQMIERTHQTWPTI